MTDLSGIRVGIITCPRRVSYLSQTLRSALSMSLLFEDQIKVFSDTTEPPPECAYYEVGCECRTEHEVAEIESRRLLGHKDGTPNLMRALRWSAESESGWACVIEDDIVHAYGWIGQLIECGQRLQSRAMEKGSGEAWVIVPHFTEPAAHFELFDDPQRFESAAGPCVLRWTGRGTERGRYDLIGIGTQCCFMTTKTARKVLGLYEAARLGEFDTFASIEPKHWAMDVGLMKMAHVISEIDLCVTVPCLVQHMGEVCAHTENRPPYSPDSHQNLYFSGRCSAADAVKSDAKPRAWQRLGAAAGTGMTEAEIRWMRQFLPG